MWLKGSFLISRVGATINLAFLGAQSLAFKSQPLLMDITLALEPPLFPDLAKITLIVPNAGRGALSL